MPYMGVIPNPKMAFIFPISCILALIFPILIKYFPKCEGKGSFLKSQIKSLDTCITTSAQLTVKPVLSGHSKIDKTKGLKTNGILMKVKSIAECSLGVVAKWWLKTGYAVE